MKIIGNSNFIFNFIFIDILYMHISEAQRDTLTHVYIG